MDILVVDDDALMRDLLTEWLSDAGYRVRQAATGADALRMLRSRAARLLISDMDMPGRDGVQTLSEARQLLPDLAMIAISGGPGASGRRSWVSAARESGATRTLAKPFDRDVLLAAVEEVLPK
ncbi:MAG TPA: response regulator [Burkholderiales bacterium]|nr:response regulator [Burkholderiales bacterium]